MKTQIEDKIKELQTELKNTLIDHFQFEKNIKADFKLGFLKSRLELIETHENFIGRQVYKRKKGFTFSDVIHETDRIYNSLESEKREFTREDFLEFERNLAQYTVDHLTRELVQGIIFNCSTSRFANLKHELIIESKQNLISFFSSFSS